MVYMCSDRVHEAIPFRLKVALDCHKQPLVLQNEPKFELVEAKFELRTTTLPMSQEQDQVFTHFTTTSDLAEKRRFITVKQVHKLLLDQNHIQFEYEVYPCNAGT